MLALSCLSYDLAKLLERYGITAKLFADDVKVYFEISGADDVAKLQATLDLIAGWACNETAIIPAFQEPYSEQLETDPVVLLSVNEPAVKFVSSEWLQLSRNAQDGCEAISKIASCCQPPVTNLILMNLPNLAPNFRN